MLVQVFCKVKATISFLVGLIVQDIFILYDNFFVGRFVVMFMPVQCLLRECTEYILQYLAEDFM